MESEGPSQDPVGALGASTSGARDDASVAAAETRAGGPVPLATAPAARRPQPHLNRGVGIDADLVLGVFEHLDRNGRRLACAALAVDTPVDRGRAGRTVAGTALGRVLLASSPSAARNRSQRTSHTFAFTIT